MRIETAIIEDDDSVRECVQLFIEESQQCQCNQAYSNAEEALEGLAKNSVDVALVDIGLPGIDGIQFIRRLKAKASSIRIVMLTVFQDDQRIFSALEAGAEGYLLKRSSPDEILQAICDVYGGGVPMTGIIARKVIQHFRPNRTSGGTDLEALSKRESEILDLLAKGDLYKEIAEKLGIGYETIHTHIPRIYEKLQVKSRTQAVAKFLNNHSEN
ncbi:MAG TPA: response regulator transcription factor [Verrucomicrobiales bacterium]|nr:response regulator transcription factor [Verrucomicrobiales bacterium]